MMKRFLAVFTALVLSLALFSPSWGLLQVNQLTGFGVVSGEAAVIVTNTDDSVDTSNATTYTFSSQSFGAAAGNRYIVVGATATASSSVTIDTVTIGGVSATEVIEDNSVSMRAIAIYVAAVPTGTTGDVVVTLSTGGTRAAIGVWRMVGNSSGTASDTAADATPSDPATASIDVPAGGAAIAVASAGPGAWTWTGLTEDFEADVEATIGLSGAHGEFATIQSGLSVEADPSAATSNLVVASWGP